MKNTYTVGIRGVNMTHAKQVVARGKRAARWIYVNLYAPPCTRYSDTIAHGPHEWEIER